MRKKRFKNVEWWILIIAIILTLIGLVALFSATQNTGYDEFKKQIIWFAVSIVLMLASMLIDYETLIKISPFFMEVLLYCWLWFFYNSNKWCN